MNECHAAVMAAREQLCDLTPLLTDCGALCGAACCHSDADGQGGVYLFPGEETLYAGVPMLVVPMLCYRWRKHQKSLLQTKTQVAMAHKS